MILLHPLVGLLLLQAPGQPVSQPSAQPAPQPEPSVQPSAQPAPVQPSAQPAPSVQPSAQPAPSVQPGTQPAPVHPSAQPGAPGAAPVGSTPKAVSSDISGRHYTDAEIRALQQRHGIDGDQTPPHKVRWKCLIADPACGFNVEINATSAYAYRLRQGDVTTGAVNKWHSGRAQYDVWINFPTVVETRGNYRFTRMTLGPKLGIIASDGKEISGNFGFASRYWFGRKRFSPALEFSAALAIALLSERRIGGFGPTRSPIGVTADIGLSIGGFGAIVVGGQLNPPLAREDIPETVRISSSGMFFVGFRGNILWGAPAALAVTTHAITQRRVVAP